jgi:uncharacterized protein (TIGR00730 family)
MSDQETRRRPYITGRSEIDELIASLASQFDNVDDERREFARQMFTTVCKLLIEDGSVGDFKLVNTTLKELRWAFKVFGPHRSTRKVTVFGSARTAPGEPAYQQAERFGRIMAEKGWGVITGAGDGIMAAAHGGAGRKASYGVNIDLPFEQQANETVRGGSKLVNFKYFFTRKLVFLKETDAIVLFPGGFGTHDEGFETLTLIQTGKADPLPVIFVEPEGSDYWAEWHEYVERHLKAPGLISPDDTALYMVTESVDEAVGEIDRYYRVYHSQRYVGEKLVLRLQRPLSEETLEGLNTDFAGLLASGSIEQVDPLPEEAQQPEIAGLPRLCLHFTRADAAGLRRLIDRINDSEEAAAPPAELVGPDPSEERADRGGTPEPDEQDEQDEAD